MSDLTTGVYTDPGSAWYGPGSEAGDAARDAQAEAPQNFIDAVRQVLVSHGAGASLSPDLVNQLATQLWTDPNVQAQWAYVDEVRYTSSQFASTYLSSQMLSQYASPQVSGLAISALESSGGKVTTAQASSFLTGGTSDSMVSLIESEAAQLGAAAGMTPEQIASFQQVAVATAYQESGLDPRAVGDQGTSFGLYQLHQGGELGSMSPDQAFDPRTNIDTALAEFVSVFQADPSVANDPGAWAAASQRPADPNGYASSVNSLVGDIQGGWVPKNAKAAGVNGLPPTEKQKYSSLVSLYQKYLGRLPSLQELRGMEGMTPDQADTYLRGLPSHIPGMSIGLYQDVKGSLDQQMLQVFGHEANDALVQDAFNDGVTNQKGLSYFVTEMGMKPGKDLPADVYNAVYNAAAPHSQATTNQPPDPRDLQKIWESQGSPGAISPTDSQSLMQTDTRPIVDTEYLFGQQQIDDSALLDRGAPGGTNRVS